MQTLPTAGRRRIYGLLGVLLLATVVSLGVAAYRQAFTPVVMVTLQADRSGLLTDPGAKVRLRGVVVGEVRSVESDGRGSAELGLALSPDNVNDIPSDATAQIAANTAFGPKSVRLQVPEGPVAEAVKSGDVLRTTRGTPEVNEVFDTLQQVLTTIQPEKLSATLGAMARTLDGRGEQLGSYLSQINEYLEAFNPHLGNLRAGIASASKVLDTYADVAPSFLRIVKNATVTGDTLDESQAGLHAMLLGLTRTAQNGTSFVDRAEEPLLTAVDALRPTTSVLAKYAPEYTCMLKNLTKQRRQLNTVMGNVVPGVQAFAGLKPSEQEYTYPEDLPKFVPGLGPDCYHLPIKEGGPIPPKYIFNDGTEESFKGRSDSLSIGEPVKLFPELFGPYAGKVLENLRGARVLPR